MKKIKLKLKEKGYDIIIGDGIINSLGELLKCLKIGDDAIIITNPLIKSHFEGRIIAALAKSGYSLKFILVPDSETSKSAQVAFKLINSIAKYDVKKRLFIIALGGGVVGDLAGFVAATYRRGIPYIQVPTTLLAQVDSAIGGKTGIDLPTGKNLVGAFNQPRLVVSDTSVLKSLSKRQIKAGLSEIIKYGVIKDAGLFTYIEKNIKQLFTLNKECLEQVIFKCSQIKSCVVARDEKETKGIRTILNFGHTIGHAIESAGSYNSYNHGEAVAVGMICASRIAKELKMLDKNSCLRIENLIKMAGLPTTIKRIKLSKIISAYEHDKKFISKKNRFVLPTRIGKVIVREDIPFEIIVGVLKEVSA